MRRTVVGVCVLFLVGLIGPTAWADPPSTGNVETLRTYDPDAFQLPEGLAVDKRGRIYLTMTFLGELRRIDPDGSERIVATLPTGGGFGPLGLAVDAPGNVYAGVVTFDPDTHGVWKVTPSGETTRLPGSQAIAFPNGLAFGDRGTLYVTDSTGGAVWRIPKGGGAELWVQSPLLAGDGSAPLPFPVGANGITFVKNTAYVTNTELASVVAIPVGADGSPGAPVVLAQTAALGGADGVAPDVHGNLYVAVIAQSTIVRVAAGGSEISLVADGSDGLDYTSSVAFGTGLGERTTIYAVNFSVGPFFGDSRTHGPALLAVDAGVPGLPQP